MSKAPFAKIDFAPARVEVRPLEGGGYLLRSPQELGPYARCLGDLLVHWAERTPDRRFIAERAATGWRSLTYGETLTAVEAIGQALLDRRLSSERPVAILSDNSIDHALLTLGAMHAGIPAAPVSPAYSLMSKDFGKLRYILQTLNAGLVYAADGQRFAGALAGVDLGGAEVVNSVNPVSGATPFAQLTETRPGPGLADAFAAIRPDTVCKYLFTSGSTGMPKGVINTHRMLCSNQQAIAQLWPFLAEKPPVIVDWLPWNHTFGGNHNFNLILLHGGTLYIDEGKPVPGLIEKTVANLREVSPTLYFNVPRGYDMLLPFLAADETVRNSFFGEMDLIFYAAAALPQNLWEWLEDLSIQARGKRVPLVASWGSTETAPMVTSVHYAIERAGVIGLPAPGCEVKMVPNAGKLELRVRGPNVMRGYLKQDELTKAAFDEEGFYKIGDAGRFADENDPAKGIEFDGRIAEDFKLMSGTWVHVGALRVKAITACAPVVQDAVITGHDREEVGMLAFANPAGCLSLCKDLPPDTPLRVLMARHEVRQHLAKALAGLAGEATGSSGRITRALMMDEPPNIDANEITDKGYINQRAVLMRRSGLVDRLYADQADPEVIHLSAAEASL